MLDKSDCATSEDPDQTALYETVCQMFCQTSAASIIGILEYRYMYFSALKVEAFVKELVAVPDCSEQ